MKLEPFWVNLTLRNPPESLSRLRRLAPSGERADGGRNLSQPNDAVYRRARAQGIDVRIAPGLVIWITPPYAQMHLHI